MEIYNDDCFNVFPKIKDKSIDLFILDLPYGQTACKWDTPIDLNEMWKAIKRIMKPNAIIVFFCTAKFGYTLIHSNPKWFRYDLVWEKSRKVGFLSASRMPLRKHELMYVFSKDNNDDIEIERNKELRDYAEKVLLHIGKTKKQIEKDFGNRQVEHFFYINSSQFAIPIKKNYEKLTELYNLTEMEDYLNYEELESKWEAEPQSTYNSQKTEGKPYKIKDRKCEIYTGNEIIKGYENKGTRHPHSILQFAEDHENIYIFSKDNNEDNEDLINYSKKVLEYIGETKAEIKRKIKDADHFFRYSKNNFSLPSKETYDKLIELYAINKMEGFVEYKDLNTIFNLETTYNSQKTEGKPYKTKGGEIESYYREEGVKYKLKGVENKGTRHPSTILKFNNPKKSLHRTQKPTDLLEWLIKSYSNEGDTIMDFTMGSGSTGIACMNTKRKFIGVEMNKGIFTIAKERLREKFNCEENEKEI